MAQHLIRSVALASILTLCGGLVAQAAPPGFPSAAALGATELADSAGGCAGPRMAVEPVQLSSNVEGAIIHFTSSEPACMGAQGEYQSLAVRGIDGRWRTALEANPQLIKVGRLSGTSAASLSVYSVAGCTGEYMWKGRRYAEHRQVTGGICGHGPFPAGLHLIEQAVIGQRAVHEGTSINNPASDPGPLRTVRAVIGQLSTMPCWCDKLFAKAAAGYATSDLIRAVGYGGRIAGAKKIDLWDADLFTGQQNLKDAKLLSGRVVSQTDGDATVVARIGINYLDGSVYPPVDLTYLLKNVNGHWLIDDFQMTATPSVKHVFLHPEGT